MSTLSKYATHNFQVRTQEYERKGSHTVRNAAVFGQMEDSDCRIVWTQGYCEQVQRHRRGRAGDMMEEQNWFNTQQ